LAEVRLQEGESIESALRRFKRKVQTEDIIKEVKRHSYYLKPGAKRRVKRSFGEEASPKEESQRAGLTSPTMGSPLRSSDVHAPSLIRCFQPASARFILQGMGVHTLSSACDSVKVRHASTQDSPR
jgi:small subunit ribosomal protein S21